MYSEFYVLLTVHSCRIFFQMKPSRCTLLLSIFISTYVHVSDNYVSIIRRTYCIYTTHRYSKFSSQTATHTE